MPRCPSCAREVADRAAFCGYCGAAIGGPAPGVAEPHSGAQPGPNYWICPRCHVENTADAQFCRSCGAVQAAQAPAATVVIPSPFALPARWRCATCNEVNDPDAQFCYYCGVPSGSASAAGAAAAAASRPYTSGGSSGGQGYPPPASAPPPAGRSWGGLLVLAAALIAVAAVGAAVAFVLLSDRGGSQTPPPGPITSPQSSTTGGGDSPSPPTAPDISAEMNAFLHQVEPLINLSGQGMHELGLATTPTDPEPGASDAIQYVIDNRTEVRQRLGNLTVPDDYQARSCRSAFKKAMTYALDADYHYLDWANGSGDKGAAGPDNLAAVDWKAQFVDIYNSLAAKYGNGMRHNWQPTDI